MTPASEVSERARALRKAVDDGLRAEALAGFLGITQEMVERLRRLEAFAEAMKEWDHRDAASDAVDFAATLLAAGENDE